MNLTLITGPMKSGKSFEMINRLAPLKHANINFAIYQSSKNKRDDEIKSRNGVSINAIKISSLKEISDKNVSLIGIDEIHMFDEEEVVVIEKMLKNNIDFIVSGLNTDYRGKMFSTIKKLLEIFPSEIVFKKAVCESCKNTNAVYTQVLKNNNPILNGLPSIIPEDGTCYYKPVCRNCFIKE